MPLQSADPAVSRAKFDREVNEFRQLGTTYRARGWFLTDAEFPNALVVLCTQKMTPASIVMGVEFDYTNYDVEPPSVVMVNPFTRVPYKLSELPSPLNRATITHDVELPGLPAGSKVALQAPPQPYMQAHAPNDIPFLCIAGVREYHDHPAHNGDLWELHRPTGAGRMVRLLEIIHRYGVEPISGFGVSLVPQVRLNFGPPPG